MTILTGAGVEKLEATSNGVKAAIKGADGKVVNQEFSHAIVAIGIAPNTENIGLEALGVKSTKGHIDTDPYGRTNVDGIWAIGDVTGTPWMAQDRKSVVKGRSVAGRVDLGGGGIIKKTIENKQ